MCFCCLGCYNTSSSPSSCPSSCLSSCPSFCPSVCCHWRPHRRSWLLLCFSRGKWKFDILLYLISFSIFPWGISATDCLIFSLLHFQYSLLPFFVQPFAQQSTALRCLCNPNCIFCFVPFAYRIIRPRFLLIQMPPVDLETAFQFIIDDTNEMKIVNAAGESVAPTLPL